MGFPASPQDVLDFAGSDLGQHWLKQIESIVGKPLHVRASGDYREETLYCVIECPGSNGSVDGLTGFGFMTMPSCPRTVISYGAWVLYGKQNKGIGKLAHGFRLEFLRWYRRKYLPMGYYSFDNVICTVSNENEAQIKILKRFEWKELLTSETSSVWGRNLY